MQKINTIWLPWWGLLT